MTMITNKTRVKSVKDDWPKQETIGELRPKLYEMKGHKDKRKDQVEDPVEDESGKDRQEEKVGIGAVRVWRGAEDEVLAPRFCLFEAMVFGFPFRDGPWTCQTSRHTSTCGTCDCGTRAHV